MSDIGAPLPPPGIPGEPPSTGDVKKVWWKRWWVIALAVLIALMVLGAVVSPAEEDATDGGDAADTTEVPVETDPPATVAPTTVAPTTVAPTTVAPTTVAPTTVAPTTVAPTTTAAATTTTEFILTVDDARTLVFPIVFDQIRDGVIEVLDENVVVESVDTYVYDSESGTVVLDITPAFDFDEGVRDDAWEIMRSMSIWWTTDNWVNSDPAWSPDFDISISTAQYRCTGDQMIQMEDARFSRADWEDGCRVR